MERHLLFSVTSSTSIEIFSFWWRRVIRQLPDASIPLFCCVKQFSLNPATLHISLGQILGWAEMALHFYFRRRIKFWQKFNLPPDGFDWIGMCFHTQSQFRVTEQQCVCECRTKGRNFWISSEDWPSVSDLILVESFCCVYTQKGESGRPEVTMDTDRHTDTQSRWIL